MVADHINYLTFEDPGAVNTLRRALKLAHAGDLHGAAETAGVDVAHAGVVSEALRRGMRFSIGAEADNDPRARPDAQNIVDAMRPDGLIRSVNFVNVDHPEKGADWAWPFDNEEFAAIHQIVGPERLWELYVDKLVDDLEKLPANIVGHFYGPANLGGWPAPKRLDEYEDRLLNVCHARGLAIEVNTRFLYRDNPPELKKRYLEANARLVRKAKALGVGIAIGSDAHSPKDQGNAFDAILKVLDDAKINELVFPVGGRLARVALRATREHLEAEAQRRVGHLPGSSITGFSRAELGLPEQAEVPASAREGARAVREAASRKRAVGSTRGGKRSEAPPPKSAAKSGSRRTPESSTSSSKAKAARAAKPPAKKAPAKKAAPTKAPPKKAPPKKVAAKPKAAPKKGVAKARPRPQALKPSPAAKRKAPARPAKKKTPPKRVPAVRKAAAKKPAHKPAAKSAKGARAVKAPAKKSVKKVAKTPSKGSATKKRPTAKRR
jgi:HisJ family histidinol phosphate phosphatase